MVVKQEALSHLTEDDKNFLSKNFYLFLPFCSLLYITFLSAHVSEGCHRDATNGEASDFGCNWSKILSTTSRSCQLAFRRAIHLACNWKLCVSLELSYRGVSRVGVRDEVGHCLDVAISH